MENTEEAAEIDAEHILGYVEIPRSDKENAVNGIFIIDLNEEISELSNDFCKYYLTTNTEDNSQFFAIIYENNFLPPVKTINLLSKNPIKGLNKIITYSIVTLSSTKAEHLVVIVDKYNPNNSLEKYLQKNGSLSLSQTEKIIEQVNDLLIKLAQKKVFGCNIKPANIIMQEDGNCFLREFVDSYPLFYQEDQYCAPELLECKKAARKNICSKNDIYSLGVSVFQVYTNLTPWEEYEDIEDYNRKRLENTSFKCLIAQASIPEKMRKLLKWTLHDDAEIRWKPQNITEWLEDFSHTVLHESILDNKTFISFNNHKYSNMKSIAYALFKNWDEAIKFVKDNKMYKWASRQQINNDLLDGIKQIVDTKSNTSFVITNNFNANNKISRLLAILDPNGGIRHEGIAISPYAIPELLYYLLEHNKKHLIEHVIKIIKDEVWKNYPNKYSIGHLNESIAEIFKSHINNINTSSPSRGHERLIYSLNPNSRCRSSVLNGMYVTNVADLLTALETHAARKRGKFHIDRNMIAFIAARLNLKEDITVSVLSHFSKFVEHPSVKTLTVLDILQRNEPNIKIPYLCEAVAKGLQEAFEEHLYNIDFKKKIIAKIEDVAKEGDLSKLVKLLSNQQKFIDDYNGYYIACKKVEALEEEIKILNNQNNVFNNSLLLGQKTTVLLSYILCFVVTIILII